MYDSLPWRLRGRDWFLTADRNEVPNAPFEGGEEADPALVQGLIDRFLELRGGGADVAPGPEEEEE